MHREQPPKDTSVKVLELAPPYVQTDLMGAQQAGDPRAMPLKVPLKITLPNEDRISALYERIIDFNAITDYGAIIQTGEAPIPMSSITIRNLDPVIKERLRVRAAEHGHSMEAEARRILQTALMGAARPPGRNLYERVRARFAPLGGVDLELPEREPARELPRLD